MRVAVVCPALALLATLFAHSATGAPPERIVGLPCEGCDAVFVGLPESVPAQTRLTPPEEPGPPLRLTGRVLDADGRPVAGIVVYAYQTNAEGRYPEAAALRGSSAEPHGRLRGWVRSDKDGNYRFDTIRPAPYPGRKDPAHIHLHVIEPGRCTYYIDDVNFSDDALFAQDPRPLAERGGSGIVMPRLGADDGWRASRDIVLGKNVPGYADCAAKP